MSSFYTLSAVDDTTPVEITGGRVGHFKVLAETQALRLGDASVTNITQMPIVGAVVFDLYVTSPDEIYVVTQTGVSDVVVFHNR